MAEQAPHLPLMSLHANPRTQCHPWRSLRSGVHVQRTSSSLRVHVRVTFLFIGFLLLEGEHTQFGDLDSKFKKSFSSPSMCGIIFKDLHLITFFLINPSFSCKLPVVSCNRMFCWCRISVARINCSILLVVDRPSEVLRNNHEQKLFPSLIFCDVIQMRSRAKTRQGSV